MKKKIICLMVMVCILLSVITIRTGYIIISGVYTVADTYNSYSLTIDNLDPQLYYSNGERLTNNKISYVAVIRPNEKCIGELNLLFDNDTRKVILDELSRGYPIKVNVEKEKKAKYIKYYKTHYSDYSCVQLIRKESSGLLNYVNLPSGSRNINFSIDAKGRLLSGDYGTINDENYNSNNGLKLTINKDIQRITSFACENMTNGCAIVMDVKTGEILACVNRPVESYVNKCFGQYCVGSVFKIVTSLCALENNIDLTYECKSNIKVGDTEYSCQNNHIHGSQNLKQALANSCNCYFVNLALELGADKLLKTAEKLGFNDTIALYDNWNIKNAQLPTINQLSSKGQLALLGFGQGLLTSTPLQICSMLCTIANDGVYNSPKLITNYKDGKQVFKSRDCKTLVDYLKNVVDNGTGRNAQSKRNESTGKTATAQTGQYINGVEQLNTWFAGVYPYSNPKYAIVVMTENGTTGSQDCCPIFRTIVENIDS